MVEQMIAEMARAMRRDMTPVNFGGEGSEGVAYVDMEAGARAAHSVIAGRVAELEAEARRFAGFYPEASDGRNTFVIFADKIAALSPHPKARNE